MKNKRWHPLAQMQAKPLRLGSQAFIEKRFCQKLSAKNYFHIPS
jgi:hypothetical protein